MLARAGLVALLALPFACGGRAQAPTGGSCGAIAWGGWDGTPDCAGLASVVIAPEFRTCRVDTDCTLIAVQRCSAHATNHQGAQALASQSPPCTLPALGGFCQPIQYQPRCQQGCCVPARY